MSPPAAPGLRRLYVSAATLSLIAACHGADPDPSRVDRGSRPTSGGTRPSVVLVTVDTLRADHLPIYGYDRRTAPAISAMATDAVVFENAFTTAPKTAPAYASMFTGMYPFRHGLRLLGQELHRDNVTLAERMTAAGYQSAGFVSSTVMIDRLSLLGQGFAVWDDRMPQRELNRDNYQRRAERTIDAVLKWLPDDGKPFFLFIHLIDPHGPYRPPAAFRGSFEPRRRRKLRADEVPGFQRVPGAEYLGDYIAGYDGEIAYADSQIARLFGRLSEEGLYDNSLVIVTADHGESFGEDGYFFRHGKTLHESSIHVPLVIKPPGGRSANAAPRSSSIVSLTDVAPTILDYAGLAPLADADGISLKPVVEGQARPEDRAVFSERWLPGRRSWAIHATAMSLRAENCAEGAFAGIEACSETCMARTDSGERVVIERDSARRQRLRASLDSFIKQAATHELPFEVLWRYRPRDKEFVRRFIAQHNLQARHYETPDSDALEALGYLENE